MPDIDTTPHCEHPGTTTMIDFDDFVNGPILDGDVSKAEGMWKEEYASARSFGWTALHLACWYTDGDREGVVRGLLDRGCDIEAEDEYTGWRPLHVCASYGNGGAMRVLLGAECDVTALTAEEETALQIAERENHDECASMLRAAVQQLEEAGNLSNSLSNSEEPETLPYRRALEAIMTKQVHKQVMTDVSLHSPSKGIEYCESLQSLHEGFILMCIRFQQNYDCRVYNMCTDDIVNKASLFMDPMALETVVVWVDDSLVNLTKVEKIMPQVLLEYIPCRIISYIKISISDIQRDTIYPLCLQSNRYIYTCPLEFFFPRSDNRLNLYSQPIAKSTTVNFSSGSCGELLSTKEPNKEGNMNEIETNEKKREFIQPAIRCKNAPRFTEKNIRETVSKWKKRKSKKSKKTKKGCGDTGLLRV